MGLAINYMILRSMFQYVDVLAVYDQMHLGKGLETATSLKEQAISSIALEL